MIGSALGLILTAVMAYYMKVQTETFQTQTALLRTQATKVQEISPTPLPVMIEKEMHERFAGRAEFVEHKAHITRRHAELFARIDGVREEARTNLASGLERIQSERTKTMEKLTEEFTFIRESMAEIKSDLKHLQKDSHDRS